MNETESRMLQEVHQVVLGVKGSEEGGIVQDIKEIRRLLSKQNGRIRKLEIALVAVAVSLSGGYGLVKLITGS